MTEPTDVKRADDGRASMNRYSVTMTVYEATSFDREIDAANEAAARQFAKQSVERDYPNASEILIDEVELLAAAEPEPQPDPLAQAREIIAGLMDAASHGALDMDLTDKDAARMADAAIEAARAFLASQEPTTCPE